MLTYDIAKRMVDAAVAYAQSKQVNMTITGKTSRGKPNVLYQSGHINRR